MSDSRLTPSPQSVPLRAFHPTVRAWFAERLGQPSPPQQEGWPAIQEGGHVLIAAPTGTGKTLAAFLWALDGLLRQGAALPNATQVLYVSPLRALSNDVQKNLEAPLAELRERDPSLPEIRVQVRTGDTPSSERAKMSRRPPHVLVTTPESLYILLTSEGGRRLLRTVQTAIVDEIHAVLGSKRGSHLALSLERLDALTGGRLQRIGLSATQKPLEEVGRFLAGAGRECRLIDTGHLRRLDLAVEIPPSPLSAVCSHETWGEIYRRMAELIRGHRTTLIFSGTRKLAERIAAQLGAEAVTCHHSSMSKERRLDAEQRLKAGKLQALVATASLELGIDIGDVDLVLQIGATRSIATFLQRVGRAGHAIHRLPKGRAFPLTLDDLAEAAALLRAVRRGILDRTPQPRAPLDVLAQQIVAAGVSEVWDEEELYQLLRRAWPYRELARADFDAVVRMHTGERLALLHRDGVHGRLRATRRARIAAVTSGGAIPDRADYSVVLEPDGTFLGTLDEDFAIESDAGDVFQLGNASWRILGVSRGVVRVADAHGQPPTLPFWLGEGPARSRELAAEIGEVRQHGADPRWLIEEAGLDAGAAEQLAHYLQEGIRVLGAAPSPDCVVAERFFDESGGMQLILHAPFGGRINRAWGLALRKRFCRHFGFELQAAANEEAILLSLGPQHSFPLEEVFAYLRPGTVQGVLEQAVLPTPTFTSRWRWNATRSLLLERMQHGRRVPPALLRMRADDLLTQIFPQVLACGETLPPGDLPIPWEHPMVRQTMEDCLQEAMDAEGLQEVLRGIEDGRIRTLAVNTPEPSVFAGGILNARPYSFLDDAPLEERRTQAVYTRRVLDPKTADELGELDAAAVRRVEEEAWPQPQNAEEAHEALLWMGYVTEEEAPSWLAWLEELRGQGRVMRSDGRWFAAEASREPKEVWRGRLEVLGPVFSDDPELYALESEGVVMRVRYQGRQAWCHRRLLARIFRYTLDALRAEIEPVTAAQYLGFLRCWQHADPEYQLEGPAGVAAVVEQLAGFEAVAPAWERHLLRARLRGYDPAWLDQAAWSGLAAWGRLWGSSALPPRRTPISLFPRGEWEAWLTLAGAASDGGLSWRGRAVLEALAQRGALFPQELARQVGPLESDLESGLQELVGNGLVTADSFASLRPLLVPAAKKAARPVGPIGRAGPLAGGRWSLFRPAASPEPAPASPPDLEFCAGVLLRRYGVLFRAGIERERLPVFWRDLARTLRTLELRGAVRGGRFVSGFAGEQFALPEAVELLRKLRRAGERPPLRVSPLDPLHLPQLLPDARSPLPLQAAKVR